MRDDKVKRWQFLYCFLTAGRFPDISLGSAAPSSMRICFCYDHLDLHAPGWPVQLWAPLTSAFAVTLWTSTHLDGLSKCGLDRQIRVFGARRGHDVELSTMQPDPVGGRLWVQPPGQGVRCFNEQELAVSVPCLHLCVCVCVCPCRLATGFQSILSAQNVGLA